MRRRRLLQATPSSDPGPDASRRVTSSVAPGTAPGTTVGGLGGGYYHNKHCSDRGPASRVQTGGSNPGGLRDPRPSPSPHHHLLDASRPTQVPPQRAPVSPGTRQPLVRPYVQSTHPLSPGPSPRQLVVACAAGGFAGGRSRVLGPGLGRSTAALPHLHSPAALPAARGPAP